MSSDDHYEALFEDTDVQRNFIPAWEFYNDQLWHLKAIKEKFKDLTFEVEKAQTAFDSVFKSAYENIEKIIIENMDGYWDLEKHELIKSLDESYLSYQISKKQAVHFINLVNMRANGEKRFECMDTLVMHSQEFQNDPAEEFRRGFTINYRTKDHPETKNLDIEINLPYSWNTKDVLSRYAVLYYKSKDGRGSDSVILLMKNINLYKNDNSKKEVGKEIFSLDNLKNLAPTGVSLITVSPTILNQQRGAELIYDFVEHRIDKKVKMRTISFVTTYNNKIIFINCTTEAPEGNDKLLNQNFEKMKPLFRLIANSFVIHNLHLADKKSR